MNLNDVFAYQTINPLTSDDAIWHFLIVAAYYQLAQSVLKIGVVLALTYTPP